MFNILGVFTFFSNNLCIHYICNVSTCHNMLLLYKFDSFNTFIPIYIVYLRFAVIYYYVEVSDDKIY